MLTVARKWNGNQIPFLNLRKRGVDNHENNERGFVCVLERGGEERIGFETSSVRVWCEKITPSRAFQDDK